MKKCSVNLCLSLLLLAMATAWCQQSELSDVNIEFKPLVDTSIDRQSGYHLTNTAFDKTQSETMQPFMLTGKVLSFQEAVHQEKNIDWYQWYLFARQYLAKRGGLACPLGTSIIFYKAGRIEANSSDINCLLSIRQKQFPLPRDTLLQALILPVRSGSAPPASPEELQSRVQASQNR